VKHRPIVAAEGVLTCTAAAERDWEMSIRTFQPGDDVAQVSIYNEAAAELPKFKPATLDEVRRRNRAADFDPTSRFIALANGRPMAYASFSVSGRVSFPWCRKGFEVLAEPLFSQMLQEMKQRGLTTAFAAYRGDWAPQRDFFLAHNFTQPREMVNYVMDLAEMPTPAARPLLPLAPVGKEDLPAILALAPQVLRVNTIEALEEYLFHNDYFPPDALFVLRGKSATQVEALGIVIANPSYSHPKQVDAFMPCFRLGAFGTEGLTTKRLNGLFSVLIADQRNVNALALDMLGYAARQLEETEVETLAAQVASDVPHLMRFYKQYFRRQGSFPIYERSL
jgi:hypothetical protein